MSTTNCIFDYKSLACTLRIDPKTLEELVREARLEFPGDDMLVELHVVRALRRLAEAGKN